MKLLITGASGFLGRHVVAAARSAGHSVRALLRPGAEAPADWQGAEDIEIVRGDLRARDSVGAMVEGVDCVVHLAAAKAGDLYEQFGGTVIATENLLAGMRAHGVSRIVLASSFAVYEYLDRHSWSVLDEQSALARDPSVRDEYCQTKLVQERLVRRVAQEEGWRCVVLRPGVIFGRDNLWNGRVGFPLGRRYWVCTGVTNTLPVTYVENCAEAFIKAAEFEGEKNELVLNVVDDELPTHMGYLREMRRQGAGKAWILPLPWPVMRFVATCAALTNRLFFRGTAKLPGLLVPARLHGRCKPTRFSNARVKSALGWGPKLGWRDGVARAVRVSRIASPSS